MQKETIGREWFRHILFIPIFLLISQIHLIAQEDVSPEKGKSLAVKEWFKIIQEKTEYRFFIVMIMVNPGILLIHLINRKQ